MIEGTLQAIAESHGLATAIGTLLAGAIVLTAAVEKLIGYLARAALGLRVSLFALAIVFAGFEFDDTVLAAVLAAGELERVALGTALGTALAIVGVTVAVAALVRPFPVDLPADYLAIFAGAPFLLVPFVLAGRLTVLHGVALVGAFVAALAYLFYREYRRDAPVFRSSEIGQRVRTDGGPAAAASMREIPEDRLVGGRSAAGWLWLGLAVVALGGVVFGSMLLEAGSEAAIEGSGVGQTVFGATVLTLILTFEDVLLTLEPVRRGIPEIGIGNVIGSVVFSVTGNVGVVALLGDLELSRSVLTVHLPAVIVVTALAAYFLHQGRVKRRHGLLLGGLYVAYWLVAVLVVGGVPLSG